MKINKEEYLELFLSEGGKKEIVRSLGDLTNTKGWQILMIYFKDMEDTQESLLHDIESNITPEDLQRIRIRLYYIKEMMGMPETLAKEILESKDTPIVSEVY